MTKKISGKKAIDDIEKYKNNPRLFFLKQIKSIKEGSKVQNCTSIMTNDDNNPITETESILNKVVSEIFYANTQGQSVSGSKE